MDPFSPAVPWIEALREFVLSPSTWWQLSVVVSGLLAAVFAGQLLQSRLHPVIQPGVMKGIRRTAMRTGALVLIPLIWWLWLLAGEAILRRWLATPMEILHYAIWLVGALTLIRMGVFVLRHSFSPGSKLKAWEGILTGTIWSIVALQILGWLPLVRQVLDEYALPLGNVRVSLYTVISFILSIALLLLLALWITDAIRSQLVKSRVLDESMKVALTKLVRFLLLTLAVLIAMMTAGIDLTALAVFGGALGVGVGLGLQRIVSNFVSGIILSFEGSIRPGDVITTANTFGIVHELHARYIVVRNRDGMDILVPNESLLTTEITNWSYGDRNIRFRLPVQISYNDDPERALEILEKAARETERVLQDPAPAARLMGFGESGIDLELRVWINDPELGVNNVRSDIYRRVWRDLKAAGITIPYPQRDVHIRDSTAEPVPKLDKPGSHEESGRGRRRDRKEESPD